MNWFLIDVLTLRIVSDGVCFSEQKGMFLWLMWCLLRAVGRLPLPVETWLWLPLTRLIWAYAERLFPVTDPHPLKPCQKNLSQILFCPIQHPTLQHSAQLHTALTAMYFYAQASFFTLNRTVTGHITQHLSTVAPVYIYSFSFLLFFKELFMLPNRFTDIYEVMMEERRMMGVPSCFIMGPL